MAAFLIAGRLPPAGRYIFPLAITYLLFLFAYLPLGRLRHWSKYGDFSYGIYLYAFPIQQLVVMQFPGISAYMLFLIATPLSIVAGFLSWHLVEKRFLRLKSKPLVKPVLAPAQ